MNKLLLILLMLPTLSFAEKYDSNYYKNWIEGECIEQSYMAKNDFVAKKIFKRCEKAAKKCIAKAKKGMGTFTYERCMRDEIDWYGSNSPNFEGML